MDCDETENRFLLTCLGECSKGSAFMASWKVVAKLFCITCTIVAYDSISESMVIGQGLGHFCTIDKLALGVAHSI